MIVHVLTADQRIALSPHIDRKQRADREQADADRVLNVSLEQILGGMIQPGDAFDALTMALVRPEPPKEGE